MAVLGTGGRLVLKRKAPDPFLVSSREVDYDRNHLQECPPGYWTGDKVSTLALPHWIEGSRWPTKQEGYASYFGSKWFLGPNRSHITDHDDYFYKRGMESYPDSQINDDAQFYARAGDLAEGDELPTDDEPEYFIHVNELGYMSFYEERCYALAGCPRGRVDIANCAGPIGIGPHGSSTYNNAWATCFNDLVNAAEYLVRDSTYEGYVPCHDLDFEPAGTDDYDNADIEYTGLPDRGYMWQVLCDIREWSLQLNAENIEVTSISEKWGNSVKSVVTGGGNIEFFIDRECFPEGTNNGLPLMEMLLMTEKGCEATAEFWMLSRGADCQWTDCKMPGDLYYEADILVTQNSVNLRPTDLVVGTAAFVTTGEIKLLQEDWPKDCVDK